MVDGGIVVGRRGGDLQTLAAARDGRVVDRLEPTPFAAPAARWPIDAPLDASQRLTKSEATEEVERAGLAAAVDGRVLIYIHKEEALDGRPTKRGRTEAAKLLQDLERAREQPVGEGVVQNEGGHRQELDLERVLLAIALQGAQIVAIAELREQILLDPPIALARREAEGVLSTSTRNTIG